MRRVRASSTCRRCCVELWRRRGERAPAPPIRACAPTGRRWRAHSCFFFQPWSHTHTCTYSPCGWDGLRGLRMSIGASKRIVGVGLSSRGQEVGLWFPLFRAGSRQDGRLIERGCRFREEKRRARRRVVSTPTHLFLSCHQIHCTACLPRLCQEIFIYFI